MIATSVSAKTVLVNYPIPLTTQHSIDVNKTVENMPKHERAVQANKTVEEAMADCNEAVLIKHLRNNINAAYNKLAVEKIFANGYHAGYNNLIQFYIDRSDDPKRVIDKKQDWYLYALFATRGYKQLTVPAIERIKPLEQHVPLVSTDSPYTMICRGVFVTPEKDNIVVQFDITRDPVTNKKSYISSSIVNTDTMDAIEKMIKLKKREAGFNETFNSLVVYSKSNCKSDCFTKEQHGLAVDFLIGEMTPEQANKAGLLR
jgi:hypothetical protein